MNLTVHIPDDEVPALRAKASGLPLETFAEQVLLERIHGEGDQAPDLSDAAAEPEPSASRPLQHIANFIVESMKDVPPEIMATMPTDGASQHDHYIYGWPKRDV